MTSIDGAQEYFDREMGDDVDQGHAYLAQADPEYLAAYQAFAKVLYGRGNAAFPPRVRKLLVIALLAGTGDWPELRLHVRRGLRDGLQAVEVLQALEITANATGMTAVVHGARILQEELEASGPVATVSETDIVARNIDTFRKLQYDVIVGGDLDGLEKIFAPTFVTERAGLADLMALSGGSEGGRSGDVYEGFRAGLAVMKTALADQSREIEEIHGTGDLVWAKWRISAIHTGPFLGRPPSGNQVSWTEVAFLRFDRQGRIARGWFLADELQLAAQLGLVVS
jgi:alkylhydroperoxidase/carboxymuconolactone decarboxylase family protein YurZ/predicted ester cyclase